MAHLFFQGFDDFFFQPSSISHPIVDEVWGSDVGFILECLIHYRKMKGKKLSHLLCLFFISLLHRISSSTLNCGFLKFFDVGFNKAKFSRCYSSKPYIKSSGYQKEKKKKSSTTDVSDNFCHRHNDQRQSLDKALLA